MKAYLNLPFVWRCGKCSKDFYSGNYEDAFEEAEKCCLPLIADKQNPQDTDEEHYEEEYQPTSQEINNLSGKAD